MNITHIAEQLHTELDQLTQELRTIAVYDTISNEWTAVPDQADTKDADSNLEADNVEEWNTRRATVSNLSTRYRNLTRALEKITAGTYGICEISGEPIEPERLAANPAARTCLAHRTEESSLTI